MAEIINFPTTQVRLQVEEKRAKARWLAAQELHSKYFEVFLNGGHPCDLKFAKTWAAEAQYWKNQFIKLAGAA